MSDKSQTLKRVEETLSNVIKQYSLNSQQKIDARYKIQLKHCIYLFTHIYALLKLVADHPNSSEVTDELFESKAIIWQACNTMLAALQLTRQGYMLEPLFLSRQAIEGLALALSFHADPKLYPAYKKGKLSGEKCIVPAKKILVEISQIYGLLSDVTHPSRNTTGTYYNEESSSLIIGGGYTEKLSYRTLFNFATMNYLLLTLWKGTELIFYKFETNHLLWKKGGNEYTLSPDDSIRVILEAVKKDFKQAIIQLDQK